MRYRHQFTICDNESTDDCLVIQDIGRDNDMSVTNDAEAVVARLVAQGYLPPGRRLEYYDSEGHRDELLVEDGKFAGFKLVVTVPRLFRKDAPHV